MEDAAWLKSVFPKSEPGAAVHEERVAAVLVLLDKKEGEWNVFLTVRSQHLRRHPGEVCLPGGMREEADDSIVRTALRESFEEVGLREESVEVICTLQPMKNKSNIIMYPVVAMLKAPFTPTSSEEVDAYFWMKLSDFLSGKNHSYMRHLELEMHSFTVHGTNVFGITSFICILVAVTVFNRYPDFPMTVLPKTDQPPREAVARVLSNGITGYHSLHKNKL